MPKLIFIDPSFSGHVYELALEMTTVGRGGRNNLVIHHPSLSAAHCEILVHGPEVIVRDLNSRNGTFVNGAKLKQSQVKHGQTVRFGSVEARLELDRIEPASDDTDITVTYADARIRREQMQRQPKPATSKTILDSDAESGAPPGSEEQTVLLPKSGLPAPAPIFSTPEEMETGARMRFRGKFIVIGAVTLLVLILLLWLVWKPR
jgi:predicted component of type VI protein secretion system